MAAEQVTVGLPQPQGRGEDPLLWFTRHYLLFLQGLYAQRPAGQYHWSDDITKTEVVITDQSPYPITKNESRPAMVVMRGPAQFANLSLDQLQSMSFRTGARQHTDLVACTMTINCIAKVGLEAQRLGWDVGRHLNLFRRLLYKGGIHHILPSSIGPESPPGALVQAEADSEAVNVVVHSPFFFQWTDKVTLLDAPILAHMEDRLTLGAVPVNEQDALLQELRLRPPTMRGQLVDGIAVPLDHVPFVHKVKI
jgi:hypothetical protein